MSRAISTLVLLVVALGLGAYIYFVERERTPASQRIEERSRVFVDLDAGTIEQLTVKGTDDQTTLEREDAQWDIVSPMTVRADETTVSSITSNLASLEIQRVVDEAPADLSQFGLAPPRAELTFRTEGDSTDRTLLLGDKTATGGDLYAKLGNESRVFLIPAYLESTLNRSTFDLRNKSVISVERDQVDGVELAASGRTIAFAKKGDTWAMTAPLSARADNGTVEGLISRLVTGQMTSIVAESPENLGEYGLDAPSGQIIFSAGSARSSLLFGGTTDDGQRYAKDASRPIVFTIASFLADDLSKIPDDFRPKDVYQFRTFTGDRFEIERDGTTTIVEKQTNEDASTTSWAVTEPTPETAVESSEIETFLSRMTGLRMESFLDMLPEEATEVARTVARWNEGQDEETVTFSRAGDDVYAVRDGEPGAATLPASDFDAAMAALETLR